MCNITYILRIFCSWNFVFQTTSFQSENNSTIPMKSLGSESSLNFASRHFLPRFSPPSDPLAFLTTLASHCISRKTWYLRRADGGRYELRPAEIQQRVFRTFHQGRRFAEKKAHAIFRHPECGHQGKGPSKPANFYSFSSSFIVPL